MSEKATWKRFSLLLIVLVSIAVVGVVAIGPANIGPTTAAAQTQTQTGNESLPSVELDNSSSTTATTITISQADLPEGGFVAIHDEAYQSGVVQGSEVAVSEYLDAGHHENIEIPVNRTIPGGNNVSRLNSTQANLTAVVYRDTNDNQEFDFARSFGETDEAYQENETTAVSDTEFVSFEGNEQIAEENNQSPSASLQFDDQELRRSNGGQRLTLSRVNLSEGGFIAVHDQRYLPPSNNPLSSTIGLSRYLEPGSHQNVTIRLTEGSINETQTIVAIPYLDTNGNQQFDYVKTGGETDYAYVTQESGTATIINQTARIGFSSAMQSQTAETASSPSLVTSTPSDSGQGEIATEVAQETSEDSPTTTSGETTTESDDGGVLGGNTLYVVAAFVVAGIALLVIWTFERRS